MSRNDESRSRNSETPQEHETVIAEAGKVRAAAAGMVTSGTGIIIAEAGKLRAAAGMVRS
jgi:hypothetical protein